MNLPVVLSRLVQVRSPIALLRSCVRFRTAPFLALSPTGLFVAILSFELTQRVTGTAGSGSRIPVDGRSDRLSRRWSVALLIRLSLPIAFTAPTFRIIQEQHAPVDNGRVDDECSLRPLLNALKSDTNLRTANPLRGFKTGRVLWAAGERGCMVRKLKIFETSLGFFDLAIAAPSMKAALEAWGADSNLFHQGVAKESDDPDVVAATMAKPGVVLRRPVGSDGPFSEHADLPTHLSDNEPKDGPRRARATPRKRRPERTRRPVRPQLRSQRSRRGVKTSAGRKRPPDRRSTSDVSRRSRRRRRRSKKANGSMKGG
jgi:colicin import membrane protein